ncbi:PREDICTED: uncharacterized protein LOC104749533 [Camelina sativa]|uniref:Uncharacterized protein LOC104749533 n=1 Tax=Camelina sativa TaxID=90675 RepID=A0ABM0WDD7_CAMSA|nr:PREDICTED: uncharacterized protein LOC104749533 [Camelina sativa]
MASSSSSRRVLPSRATTPRRSSSRRRTSVPKLVLRDDSPAPGSSSPPPVVPPPSEPMDLGDSDATASADVPEDDVCPPTFDIAAGCPFAGVSCLSFPARCASNRLLVAACDRHHPILTRPTKRAHNLRFASPQAVRRYRNFDGRKIIAQKILPLGVSSMYEAQQLIDKAGLLRTVRDVEPFNIQVVYEFYANLADLDIRKNGFTQVYLRGMMFEFSPSLINRMFDIDITAVDPKKPLVCVDVSMNEIADLLSAGNVKRWKYLTTSRFDKPMIMLQKISCFNWSPTTNKNSLQHERSKLLYMIATGQPFNFGQFVYDHVRLIGGNSGPSSARLPFSNLIYQLLCFQREVPVYPTDKFSVDPKDFALDPKNFSQLDTPLNITPRMELADDLSDVIEPLLKMKARLAGGEYDDPVDSDADDDGDDAIVASDGENDAANGDGEDDESDGDGDDDAVESDGGGEASEGES